MDIVCFYYLKAHILLQHPNTFCGLHSISNPHTQPGHCKSGSPIPTAVQPIDSICPSAYFSSTNPVCWTRKKDISSFHFLPQIIWKCSNAAMMARSLSSGQGGWSAFPVLGCAALWFLNTKFLFSLGNIERRRQSAAFSFTYALISSQPAVPSAAVKSISFHCRLHRNRLFRLAFGQQYARLHMCRHHDGNTSFPPCR